MQGKNKPLARFLEKNINKLITSGYSAFILGPRQVGKTTLIKQCLGKLNRTIEYPLQNPAVRLELETNPAKIINQIEAIKYQPYVFIDEAQKIPEILDAVQYLIDNKKAKFILTGSSARKLRRKGVNLLPGRVKRFYLDPLSWGELGYSKNCFIKELLTTNINHVSSYSFEDSLVYGSLPGIINLPQKDRIEFLNSYAQIYLEEEIRAEALSRKIGAFSRFLELAAIESSSSPNLANLSQQSGVSQPAIKEFYHLLEDTLIIERVDPYRKNARKRIFSSPRYYFFDIGVRNSLARLPLTSGLVNAQKGVLFEHAVVLEIIKRIRLINKNYKLYFWRTLAGAEVDCVVDLGDRLIPIEIKSGPMVFQSELKGLKIFLEDYKNLADLGYVITFGGKKERLAENIFAIPWDQF